MEINNNQKICTQCSVSKKLLNYGKDRTKKDGLQSWCKDCCNSKKRSFYFNNKPRLLRSMKDYYSNNKEKVKEKNIKYNLKNKLKIGKYKLQWTNKNKNKIKIYGRRHFNKNYYFNAKFRIDARSRSRINSAIRGKLKNLNYLPFTIPEMKKYLESKFEPWMNWDNYGKNPGQWVVDHIKPTSSFKYASYEDKEYLDCWSLNNLQPLESIKNIKKSNKIV